MQNVKWNYTVSFHPSKCTSIDQNWKVSVQLWLLVLFSLQGLWWFSVFGVLRLKLTLTFERWLGMVTYLRPVNVIIFIASDVPQCVNKYWNKGIPNLVSIIQIFVRSINCCVCVTEIFLVCVPWVVKCQGLEEWHAGGISCSLHHKDTVNGHALFHFKTKILLCFVENTSESWTAGPIYPWRGRVEKMLLCHNQQITLVLRHENDAGPHLWLLVTTSCCSHLMYFIEL